MAKRAREASLSSTSSVGASPEAGAAAGHTPKYAELTPSPPPSAVIQCLLAPHAPMSFPSYAQYEAHYVSAHVHRCAACHANLPSAHFLALHLTEHHDPLAAARRDGRGEKIFACFVEGCDKVCATWLKRRSHLVDKHGFPRNYDFLVVAKGIDGRRSMLRPGVDERGHRRSSREKTSTTDLVEEGQGGEREEGHANRQEKMAVGEAEETTAKQAKGERKEGMELEGITQSMSSLQFVPKSVSFGKRKGHAGLARS